MPTKPKFFYGWVIVGICLLLGVLGTGVYAFTKGIFLVHLAEELAGGSRMHISLAFSVLAIVGALISPALGRYLDEHSPRKVMLVGVAVSSASFLLLAQTQTLLQLYLVVALGFGIGINAISSITRSRAVVSWFDHWRGRAFGIAIIGGSLAGVLLPPLTNTLVEETGWRDSYTFFGTLMAVTLLPIVWFFMRDRPEEIGEVRDGHAYVAKNQEEMVTIPQDDRFWTWQELLKTPAFWSIGCIFGVMGCVFSVVMLHLFAHLMDIGLASGQAALVLSTVALFATMSKPAMGWLADTFGSRVSISLSLTAQAVALFLFTRATTFEFALMAAALHGFGYSGLALLRTFAMSTSIGSRSLGLAYGVGKWIELPFVLSASPMAGLIYDMTGSYNIAFSTLAVLLVLGCTGTLLLRVGGAAERHRLMEKANTT